MLELREFDSLRGVWGELYGKSDFGVLGLDATSSFEFSEALFELNSGDLVPYVWVLSGLEGVSCIIPLALSVVDSPVRHKVVTFVGDRQFDDGRLGFVGGLDGLESFSGGFIKELPVSDWDVLRLSYVRGSRHHKIIQDALARARLKYCVSGEREVAFFDVPDAGVDYLMSLPSKFRSNINRGIKQLSALGCVTFRHYFEDIDVEELLQAVCVIERSSWKYQSGSDLCTKKRQLSLYRALIPKMVKSRMFVATVMFLDDVPVAHIFGTVSGGVFSDHKNSHNEVYSRYSAGHVCRHEHIKFLQRNGVRGFDFMGVAEGYKMLYPGAQVYSRVTLNVYNDTLLGRYLYCRSLVRGLGGGLFFKRASGFVRNLSRSIVGS